MVVDTGNGIANVGKRLKADGDGDGDESEDEEGY